MHMTQNNIKFPPTAQQVSFRDFCLNSTGHGALIARAGCGKTSTIMIVVEALAERFPQAEITVCAYNKAIAVEIAEKFKAAGLIDWKRYQASTIHSMGYSLLKFKFKPTVDDAKVRKIVRKIADAETARLDLEFEITDPRRPRNWAFEYKAQIEKLVAIAKQAAVGYFDDLPISNVAVWAELADHYDVNGFEETSHLDHVIALAQKVYNISLADTATIDYDDMVLFPLIKNLSVRFGRDFIFLDEAQDLSRARQALAKKFLKPRGRMMVVGDDRQAIYGFSGADADALENLCVSLNATVFPLNVTWRCPKAVVAVAQNIVPDIRAAETAPEGVVETINALPADLQPGDAILCRKTAPLISACYRLIRDGKAAQVEGRALGAGLIEMTNRWKLTTIDAFLKKLETYREREVSKAIAKDKDSKVEQINDICDTLVELCKVCIAKKQTQIQDVRNFIDAVFSDGAKDVITLATYHRSKGREWNRVFLYNHNVNHPSKYAKQDWQIRQEQNLAYVAITRAKKGLYYVETPEED